MVNWDEPADVSFSDFQDGCHEAVCTGVGESKKDEYADTGGKMIKSSEKGPRVAFQFAHKDGPDCGSGLEWVTLNSNTAWKIKQLNSAMGVSPAALGAALSPLDNQITDKSFPMEGIKRLEKLWTGRPCFVTIEGGKIEAVTKGYRAPRQTGGSVSGGEPPI